MDLALLRTFLAVHRAGSLTRAAADLGVSQPAVTAQIRTLEQRVGRELFVRLPRGVAPTAPPTSWPAPSPRIWTRSRRSPTRR